MYIINYKTWRVPCNHRCSIKIQISKMVKLVGMKDGALKGCRSHTLCGPHGGKRNKYFLKTILLLDVMSFILVMHACYAMMEGQLW